MFWRGYRFLNPNTSSACAGDHGLGRGAPFFRNRQDSTISENEFEMVVLFFFGRLYRLEIPIEQ